MTTQRQRRRQTTASDKHVRRLQSQLQSTAEQPAVVEQVVGASGRQAVEPGQPGQPAAATIAQPGVPRYVVPPATGDLAFGSSHWDGKPAEIHALILKHAGPLTLFVNGMLGDPDSLDRATERQLWIDAFKMDWQGDLTLLPDARLTADNGLLLAHSRSMYDRLCKRFPQYIEKEYARDDANNNNYDVSFSHDHFDSRRLLLIPMRHGWFDLLDFSTPITLARMAIRFGCLDLLKHLDDKYKTLQRWMAVYDGTTRHWSTAVDQAADRGQLDVVQYLFSLGVAGCTTAAMNYAAGNSHLHVLKWLHENRTEGCTTYAMNGAATYGHLHVVKWLHENRTEGCTEWAMDKAAENGHLHIVEWLHANRTEGCTTGAMDSAAIFGHLHVIKWLHENRTEGCTGYAMFYAAQYGRFDIVQWLHETRGLECTSAALDAAISRGHSDVIKYMHSKGCRASSDVVRQAAEEGDAEMLQHLLDCGYAVGLEALERAETMEIAEILLGSLTLDRAQALLAEAKQEQDDTIIIEQLQSTIEKLQTSTK